MDINYVEKSDELSESERTVLLGIHKRNLSLADEPSKIDLDFLQDQYKRKSHSCAL